ncbi:DUF899 family protein [Paractinoplanes hotanensis]|uniref:DUF899 domain-containing protein n=1 Tax=Paractinoplanes hotanensis TaxID=2906497 RepID=A0ABT0Y7Q5_9ACTN|nr:DUF899 family protein [Actinoplanes hotanensis]MCM4082072.1 DUF899 domain-containing protein [Actinoplanes hotanensis]
MRLEVSRRYPPGRHKQNTRSRRSRRTRSHRPYGLDGPVPLIDVFEGRTQLFASYHMWHTGRSAADQCEGCTFFTGQVLELSYLHSRGAPVRRSDEDRYRSRR